MSDYIRERLAERLGQVQARLAELDTEIAESAARTLASRGDLSGAARRVLADKIIEKLCWLAVADSHDAALESELEGARKLLEHEDRVAKPQREAEERQRQQRLAQEANDQRVRDAVTRVKTGHAHAGDIEFLKRNSAYSDRYIAPGYIDALIYGGVRIKKTG